MRKGYTLTEILVVLVIMMVLALPLSRLSKVVIYDIPRSMKLIQCNTSLLNAVQCIRRDINSADAVATPKDKSLMIEQDGKKVCYLFEQGTIIRTIIGDEDSKDVWQVPFGKIEWQVWEKDGKGYAVEIKKYVELKRHNNTDKKMENSYVFFPGAFREAVQ